jgi:hypothetical protein
VNPVHGARASEAPVATSRGARKISASLCPFFGMRWPPLEWRANHEPVEDSTTNWTSSLGLGQISLCHKVSFYPLVAPPARHTRHTLPLTAVSGAPDTSPPTRKPGRTVLMRAGRAVALAPTEIAELAMAGPLRGPEKQIPFTSLASGESAIGLPSSTAESRPTLWYLPKAAPPAI